MKLYFSRYLLAGKSPQPDQAGALLKIEEDGFFGVADICPKIQFGDLGLREEIKTRGLLYRRALELATEDLQARKNGLSLLQDRAIANNVLITNYNWSDLKAELTYKIKADHNFSVLLDVLQRVPFARIDFNASLNADQFDDFLKMLTPELVKKIEYIEDPTELNANWKRWNLIVPLAFDLQKNKTYDPALAGFRIIKPSRQSVPAETKNVIFTSAMDHPVGVAHGLRIAQKLATKVSGFLTLNLFKETEFNKHFIQSGHLLNFSAAALNETGIGMQAELAELDWTALD